MADDDIRGLEADVRRLYELGAFERMEEEFNDRGSPDSTYALLAIASAMEPGLTREQIRDRVRNFPDIVFSAVE